MENELPEFEGKTDAEIIAEFLAEYEKLSRKYGCDFMQPTITPVRVNFAPPK